MTEMTTTAMPAQTSAPSLVAGILFKQAKIVMMVTSAIATAAPTTRGSRLWRRHLASRSSSRPSLVMSAAMMATKMKMIAAPRCALHPDAVMVCNRQMRHAMTATRCRPIAASMIAPWPAVAMESSRMASSSAMAPRIVQRMIPMTCGNGVVEGTEVCDDGNDVLTDACAHCRPARPGDGLVRSDKALGEAGYEACDDGNERPGDDCSVECLIDDHGNQIGSASVLT